MAMGARRRDTGVPREVRMEASNKLQERIQSYHGRSFLKAAMAASALAAYADGKVSLV